MSIAPLWGTGVGSGLSVRVDPGGHVSILFARGHLPTLFGGAATRGELLPHWLGLGKVVIRRLANGAQLDCDSPPESIRLLLVSKPGDGQFSWPDADWRCPSVISCMSKADLRGWVLRAVGRLAGRVRIRGPELGTILLP